MARHKPVEPTHTAIITVSAGGRTQTYDLRDIDFDQKRDEAALGIGRQIIDYIYNATEGHRRDSK